MNADMSPARVFAAGVLAPKRNAASRALAAARLDCVS
jgi:hypothetical protein